MRAALAGKVREPDVMVMLNEHLDRVQQQHWRSPDLVVESRLLEGFTLPLADVFDEAETSV